MDYLKALPKQALVAPLAGSVDRNMGTDLMAAKDESVAPLAGSVDRNKDDAAIEVVADRRSPRGERG